MLCASRAERERAWPLAQRLAALLAHQDRLFIAAQAVVKGRERELEMARLELRAAEYARDVLERRLEALLDATARESRPAAGEPHARS